MAVSLTALPALADDAVPAAAEIVARERPSTRSFYGWQILATGEAGGLVAAAAIVLPETPLKEFPSVIGFLAGMPFYALGGPATHWTHGNFQKGLISFGANVVGVLAGGFIGKGIGCGQTHSSECGTNGFFTGFAIAIVTVPVADALVLGWEDIPDDDPLPSNVVPAPKASANRPFEHQPFQRERVPQFSMTPTWSLGPRGELAFGVSGRF
jgi:hypothetical protein